MQIAAETPTALLVDSGRSLLVAEYAGRRLARYARPAMRLLDELRYPVPMCGGGIEALVPSPTRRLVAGWFNSGQGENGYDVYALDGPLRRVTHLAVEVNPMDLGPMHALPVFSPDERLLACSPGVGYRVVAWWTPPYERWPADWAGEEIEVPAEGGPTRFGSLVLHDLDRDVASTHELRFDLEPGWVPADPYDDRWHYGVVGLRFTAADRIELDLPDGTTVELVLPLPDTLTLPAPVQISRTVHLPEGEPPPVAQ